MSNIFQIQQDYFEILSQLEDNEGIFSPELEEALRSNEEDFNYKVENCVKMIHHWEGELMGIEAEIERLTKLKKRKDNAIDALKNNISYSLQSRNIGKLTVGTHNLSFRTSKALIVGNPDNVPDEFITTKEVETIDKNALKAWIDKGNEVEGTYIETRQNLQIK
jgi:hypothetical protein